MDTFIDRSIFFSVEYVFVTNKAFTIWTSFFETFVVKL